MRVGFSGKQSDQGTRRSLVDRSFREAKWMLLIWFVSSVWTLGYCLTYGYAPIDPNDLEISFGMPSWVFWGVGLPWLTTMLISIGFALVGIQDDDLGVMESALDQSPHEMTSGSHPILDVSEDAVPSTLGRPSDDEVVGNQGGTDRSSNQGEGT